jgi:8-oxo-dGTP pyrophosphatase MutT (NUDIX family)
MAAFEELARALGELLVRPEDAVALAAPRGVESAVLIPLYPDGEGLVAVFTKRRSDLRRHAGEISFPGGRRDPGEDLRQTAMREAWEEIGLAPEAVTLVGALPPTSTVVTNYAIYPFVGLIEPGARFNPNPTEVDEVVELAIADLIAGFERKRLIRRGVPIKTGTYTVGGHFIWGATARVLAELLQRLRPMVGISASSRLRHSSDRDGPSFA